MQYLYHIILQSPKCNLDHSDDITTIVASYFHPFIFIIHYNCSFLLLLQTAFLDPIFYLPGAKLGMTIESTCMISE